MTEGGVERRDVSEGKVGWKGVGDEDVGSTVALGWVLVERAVEGREENEVESTVDVVFP